MIEKINEKVSLKSIIIGLSFFIGTKFVLKTYDNYKFVKELYDVINNDVMNSSEALLVDKVKNDLIENVKKSDLFNKYGKEYILDSLKSSTIKISKSELLLSKSNGFFFHLPVIKEHFKLVNILTSYKKPKSENVIVIEKRLLEDYDYFESVLVHELYHYIDHLYKESGGKYSNMFFYEKFLDTKITDGSLDKAYLNNKMLKIFGKDALNIFIKTTLDNEFFDILKNDIDYYKSDKELYARINTLIFNMKKYNTNNIYEYFNILMEEENYYSSDIILILILDLEKVDELLSEHS